MTDDTATPFPSEPDDPRWREIYAGRVPSTDPIPTRQSTPPLGEEFGRHLDTIEKARKWLTNPHNWHDSKLFIMKWDGLLCTVMREHGERLIREWWDDGLPWCVVAEQRKRKSRASKGEQMEDPATLPAEGEE